MNWYEYPTTFGFGLPEGIFGLHSGIDIGTPNNTPIFFPIGGKVIVANYKPWGGQVAVATSGNIIEYVIHLNNVYVKEGQIIKPGDIIGTSGGGIGDKLLNAAGTIITVATQGQYLPYSNGYHTHFGLVRGSTANEYNISLGQNQYRIDPTNLINTWRTYGNVAASNTLGIGSTPISNNGSSVVNTGNNQLSSPLNIDFNTLSFNPVDEWLKPVAKAAEKGIDNFIAVFIIFIVAIIAIFFGVFLLVKNENIGLKPPKIML